MINILEMPFTSITNLLANLIQPSTSILQNIPQVTPPIVCPSCGSHHVIKNGSIHNGKSKNACKDCGRQFVNNPSNTVISPETKQLIDKLFLERISLRGIVRATEVSWSWLQNYVNHKMTNIPRQIKISDKSKGRGDY